MSARRLLLVGLAYLVFDLADPILPGAFSFEVRNSEIDGALHVRRRPEDRRAAPPASCRHGAAAEGCGAAPDGATRGTASARAVARRPLTPSSRPSPEVRRLRATPRVHSSDEERRDDPFRYRPNYK